VGALSLYVRSVRSGPPLELWHTVELETEFRADRVGEIASFEDYLALEQRLFVELDERVYARTTRGEHRALARYSTGSLADPRRFETDWNRSFELSVDAPRGGVLLVHGMTDSPYSLRALGEALHEQGYHVVGLRLPGHGTVPSGLTSFTWQDMSTAVSLAADHLAAAVGSDSVHVIGYSNGAALALHQTLEALAGRGGPTPASLVLVSPSIAVSPAAAGARWLGLLAKLPGLEKVAWTQVLPEFDPFKYNSFAVNAGDQVHRLTRRLVREIEARSHSGGLDSFPPTLAFLSTVDATVTADAVIDSLLEHLPANRNALVLFDINRSRTKSSLLVSDPGPLTDALLRSDALPFHLTVVGNETPSSRRVVARRKPPFSRAVAADPLDRAWPAGTISLSHVALPFPDDDPLYGARRDGSESVLHLGDIAFRGERGLLSFPDAWLVRLRHNPFYDYLQRRTLDWIESR